MTCKQISSLLVLVTFLVGGCQAPAPKTAEYTPRQKEDAFIVTVGPARDVKIPSDVSVRFVVCSEGGTIYYQKFIDHKDFCKSFTLPIGWPKDDPGQTSKVPAEDEALYLFARGDADGQQRYISGLLGCSHADYAHAQPLDVVLVPVRE